MATSEFKNSLYLLQELANAALECGSDLIPKSQISLLFSDTRNNDGELDWASIQEALISWSKESYIELLADPRTIKDKENCFRVLRPITAVSGPKNQAG